MAERSPSAARAPLNSAMQRCLSLVSTSVLITRRPVSPARAGREHVDVLSASSDLPLRGRDTLLFGIRARIESLLVPDGWVAAIVGYQVTISDAAEQEIVAYHWHPQGRSPIIEPHLHIGAGAQAARAELSRAHLPTGIITLADVVALLIDSFEVRPRRADWRDVLARARETFASR